MGITIEGRSGNKAEVNSRGELLINAVGLPEITKVALTTGQAYAWNSQDADVNAGDCMLAIRNESPDQDLVIDRLIICSGNAATRYEVYKVTAAYTPAGTAFIGVPLGPGGGTALVDARADEDNATQVAALVFMEVSLLATTTLEVQCGMVLGGEEAIAIQQVAESDSGAIIAFGYFVDRD